jgi:GDP-4-dehydro-6-deoxy-D-mannose reductase
MKKKVAFITGISGMVGSHLAEYLIKQSNFNIVGMIRSRSSLKNISNLTKNINEKKRIELVYADLKDSVSITKAIKETKPNYVFHLAAQSDPKTSFYTPLETTEVNIQGTIRLLEACREYVPKSLIHVCSSSEVYGRVKKENLPIDENCPFHPASPYAISKIGTDLVGRHYAEAYNMNIMTTRMFTHTGPRRSDFFAESSFAKQIAMIEKKLIKPIIYHGNLNSLRTIADVRDAVRAYYLLLTKNPKKGESYNIGGTYTCKIGDMLNYLISISKNKNIKKKLDKNRLRPLDADLQVPNTTKFYNQTKWKPQYKFKQTMKDLLKYWRKEIKDNANEYINR